MTIRIYFQEYSEHECDRCRQRSQRAPLWSHDHAPTPTGWTTPAQEVAGGRTLVAQLCPTCTDELKQRHPTLTNYGKECARIVTAFIKEKSCLPSES